jgi:hypothetical protein
MEAVHLVFTDWRWILGFLRSHFRNIGQLSAFTWQHWLALVEAVGDANPGAGHVHAAVCASAPLLGWCSADLPLSQLQGLGVCCHIV